MSEKSNPQSSGLFTENIRGHDFPKLGFGTYELKGDVCRKAVAKALETGFRHIDNARMYGNEEDVGRGIKDSGVPREEFYLTSKIWWEDLSPEGIRSGVDECLKALQTDYLDLLLIHWPNPEFSHRKAIETFNELGEAGKIRLYGVSNFTPTLFQEATDYGEIFCNQVEYHPLLGQEQLIELVRKNDSALIAYSPLGQGAAVGYPELEEIAGKHGKTSEQVALRWLIQQDNVFAIPRSSNPEHIESNFDIFDFELDESDLRQIADLPKDRRQIDPDFAPEWENANTA